MEFTFKEIDHLINQGYLDEEDRNKFGVSMGIITNNGGFASARIYKENDGTVVVVGNEVYNVDPDDGSFDSKYYKNVYKNFDDYLKEIKI